MWIRGTLFVCQASVHIEVVCCSLSLLHRTPVRQNSRAEYLLSKSLQEKCYGVQFMRRCRRDAVNKTSGQADPGLLFWAVDRNWVLPLEHYRVREGNTKD
jgi:hypothetical protein